MDKVADMTKNALYCTFHHFLCIPLSFLIFFSMLQAIDVSHCNKSTNSFLRISSTHHALLQMLALPSYVLCK
ncbi:hypothetical protein GGI43DRAFT_148090 [Trichoderma evansii]